MVLESHVKKKRRLLPPFLAELGDNYSPYSWEYQIVPEVFWIALLIDDLGPVRGVSVANELTTIASSFCSADPIPMFAAHSTFDRLTDDERAKTKGGLTAETLSELQNTMSSLSAVWPDNPLSFLGQTHELDPDLVLKEKGEILQRLYDRHSREATICIATVAYLGLLQEKIILTAEIAAKTTKNFKEIEHYPDTEESRLAGSSFRAMAPLIPEVVKDNGAELGWTRNFWNRISYVGECYGDHQEIPELPDLSEGIEGFITAFVHFANKDLRNRQEAWGLDLNSVQEQQVILSLLARQTTLAIEIVSSPGIWNANVAPVLLRTMADVHITTVWLMGDLEKRTEMFVKDGLGTIKLEIAHRRKQMEKTPDEAQDKYVEHLESWLESQQMQFLTEVNLGSWSGKSTRVMAEEAGCLDFYNYVFQPFSSAVHSYWSHTGRMNVETCQNPAHRFHFLPIVPSLEPDTHWCELAAKYLSKTLRAFDEFLGLEESAVESQNVVWDAFYNKTGDDEGLSE